MICPERYTPDPQTSTAKFLNQTWNLSLFVNLSIHSCSLRVGKLTQSGIQPTGDDLVHPSNLR